MLVNINDIKVKEGRRELSIWNVDSLAISIQEIGLLHPITIDADNTLLAGLHRLEAVKSLGWTEVECTVTDVKGLLAELVEIDENIVRNPLSTIATDNLMLRRKEIYEELHPETRHGGIRQTGGGKSPNCQDAPARSFAEDTAEKLGVSSRTVLRSVQRAKNMTQEAKDIIQQSGTKVTRQNLDKLSHLEPAAQKEAAEQLAAGTIKSVDEYQKPVTKEMTHEEKNRSMVMDTYMSSLSELIRLAYNFQQNVKGILGLLTVEDYTHLMERLEHAKHALDEMAAAADSDEARNYLKEKETENGNE